MMLSSIKISNVRNIRQLSINFGPRFNIFHGENGAGKSAILEAIYLLSAGKSFRTHHIKKLISYEESQIILFAQVQDNDDVISNLGLLKSAKGNEIRINGEDVKSISELAIRLPVLVTTQDSHKLIDSGPQWRRQFLDWGLFHVKHEFLSVWKNYNKLLKQRNSALFNGCHRDELIAWDNSLAHYGQQYDQIRKTFINEFTPYFVEFSQYLLGKRAYNLVYQQGWPKDLIYAECLDKYREKDVASRRTEYGPHRADLRIEVDLQNSRDTASRGQQKLLVYALNFALIAYLEETKGIKTLMLLDDLGSELDPRHTAKLLRLLRDKFSQVCITTANLEALALDNYDDVKLFHVKHGELINVTN